MVDGSNQVFTDRLKMKNLAAGAIAAHSAAQLDVRTTTITGAYPVGCVPAPAISADQNVAGGVRDSRVSGDGTTGSVGVAIGARFALGILDSTVDGWATGVKVASIDGRSIVVRSSLRENSIGLSAAPAAKVDVSSSQIENNLTGLQAGALRMRLSTVTGNLGTGVLLEGPVADFGTIADPGTNVFQGNGPNGGVRVGSANASGKVLAAGNTWEPGVKGSDGAGHYPGHPFVTGLSPLAAGRTFRLPASALASAQL